MAMRIVIENSNSTARFTKAQKANGALMREAMLIEGKRTASEIQERGRSDIAAAGKFGAAWTQGFVSQVEETSDGAVIATTMSGPRWKIFQEGRTIKGRPLLWIPLSGSGAPRSPRDYPGGLFRVDRTEAGKAPLLFSNADGKPKYHGQPSVTIPKKFHLIEITAAVTTGVGARIRKTFKGLR